MKAKGYVLVSVLIMLVVLTGYDIYRYQQFREQRQLYSRMHDELMCSTMSNLAGQNQGSITFNTGTVQTNGDVVIHLNNGYTTTDWRKGS